MIPGSFDYSSHDTGIDGPFLSFEQALINHYQGLLSTIASAIVQTKPVFQRPNNASIEKNEWNFFKPPKTSWLKRYICCTPPPNIPINQTLDQRNGQKSSGMHAEAVGSLLLFHMRYIDSFTYLNRETFYQKFIFEHSVSEDRITALWGKIHGLAVKYRVCEELTCHYKMKFISVNRMVWKTFRRIKLHNRRPSKKSR